MLCYNKPMTHKWDRTAQGWTCRLCQTEADTYTEMWTTCKETK